MGRHKVREKVIEMLYQIEFQPQKAETFMVKHGLEFTDDAEQFYVELIEGIVENKDEIDKKIQEYLKEGWLLARLALVDQAILRLAVYELVYREDIPGSVTINEAVELAKLYSVEESVKFINGILGQMYTEPESELELN